MAGVDPHKPQAISVKAPPPSEREQLRQQLLEMIRRSEAQRRLKAR